MLLNSALLLWAGSKTVESELIANVNRLLATAKLRGLVLNIARAQSCWAACCVAQLWKPVSCYMCQIGLSTQISGVLLCGRRGP
jgi:hypothetical protein